jgi:two-component system, NtrC family, response regulator HydG
MKKPLEMGDLLQTIEMSSKPAEPSWRILVVEDDRTLCDNLIDVLNAEGYRVAVAHDGIEAVAESQSGAVDILLLDMKLPNLNGLEVYRLIKSAQPDVVAIIMTGYAKELNDLVDQAISENAFTCITKPLDVDELLTILNAVDSARRNGTYRKPRPETF